MLVAYSARFERPGRPMPSPASSKAQATAILAFGALPLCSLLLALLASPSSSLFGVVFVLQVLSALMDDRTAAALESPGRLAHQRGFRPDIRTDRPEPACCHACRLPRRAHHRSIAAADLTTPASFSRRPARCALTSGLFFGFGDTCASALNRDQRATRNRHHIEAWPQPGVPANAMPWMDSLRCPWRSLPARLSARGEHAPASLRWLCRL